MLINLIHVFGDYIFKITTTFLSRQWVHSYQSLTLLWHGQYEVSSQEELGGPCNMIIPFQSHLNAKSHLSISGQTSYWKLTSINRRCRIYIYIIRKSNLLSQVHAIVSLQVVFPFWWQQSLPWARDQFLFISMNVPSEEAALFYV